MTTMAATLAIRAATAMEGRVRDMGMETKGTAASNMVMGTLDTEKYDWRR